MVLLKKRNIDFLRLLKRSWAALRGQAMRRPVPFLVSLGEVRALVRLKREILLLVDGAL